MPPTRALVGLHSFPSLRKSYVSVIRSSHGSVGGGVTLYYAKETRKIPRGTPFLTAYDIVLLSGLCRPDVHGAQRPLIGSRIFYEAVSYSEMSRCIIEYTCHPNTSVIINTIEIIKYCATV